MFDHNYITSPSLIIKNEVPKKIISWITILIITLGLLVILANYYKYHKYIYYQGNIIKENGEYVIKAIISEKDLIDIQKSKLVINNKYFNYIIKDINLLYYGEQKNYKYYEVILYLSQFQNNVVNNMPVLLEFELSKTTLIKEIINKIKKGMM